MIDQYCDIPMKLDNLWKEEQFHKADIGPDQVILGIPWLQKFNPTIDWMRKLIKEVLEVPLHLERQEALPGLEITVPTKGLGQGKKLMWKDEQGTLENTSKQPKGTQKIVVPVQRTTHDPPPHLNKEESGEQLGTAKTLGKILLEQEGMPELAELDILFDAVMDQEGSKCTLESQTEAIPEQDKRVLTTPAEEPQIEEALQ